MSNQKRAYRMTRRAELEERTRRRITESAVALHEQLGPAQTSITAIAELARRRRERASGGGHGGAGRDAVVSPMQGTVLAVEVEEGQEVEAGQVLCIVEAMKMENEVHAHRAGRVTELSIAPGQPVKTGQVICVVAGS